MTPELEQLHAELAALRSGVLKKLAGLSEEDARRSTVGSGTNLAGLVQYLTLVESKWFEEVVAGGSAARTMDSTWTLFHCRHGRTDLPLGADFRIGSREAT